MTTKMRAATHFSVNLAQLKHIDADNPHSTDAVAPHNVHGLSTQDRLYFSLWQNSSLLTRIFNPGDKIAMRGNRVHTAHVVLSGSVNLIDEKKHFNCGPGSVIGLAEGLAGLPHSFTVIAKNTVTTRLVPMEDARHALAGINAGLRGIFRAAIVRTLGLNAISEALK